MKNSVRRVITTLSVTSMAASLVACNAAPQFAPGAQLAQRPVNAMQFRRASAAANKVDQAAARGLDHVPGEFIVKLRPGASAAALNQAQGFSAMNAQTTPIGNAQSGIVLVKAGGAMAASSEAQTLQALQSNPAVLYAEPNWIVTLDDQPSQPSQPVQAGPNKPNDPLYDKQYHHMNMNSEAGWGAYQPKGDFILSIVDTGVDMNHPDLKAKLLPGYNAVDKGAPITDGNGHGTHCAGIAAGITNNGVGIAGVAGQANVKILPVKVLSDSGSGSYAGVADGIIKAADMGAKVISMSLGGPRSSAVVDEAVKHAMSKGALLIAAQGNSGHWGDRPIKSYPAAIDGVMSVGATDQADKLARFSQIGDWIDVTAPGVDIMATFPTHSSSMPGKDYGAISGTSMATPAVAGLAALVWSMHPGLNAQQVEEHVEKTSNDKGDAGFDIFFGHGIINVERALTTAPGAQALPPSPVQAAAFQANRFRSFR